MSRRLRRLHRRQIIKKKPSSLKHEQHAQEVPEHKSEKRSALVEFYDTKYKTLLLIPFLLLFISVAILGYNFATTGDFIELGVSIKGGISATLHGDFSQEIVDIESYLIEQFPSSDISIRGLSGSKGEQIGITMEITDITEPELRPVIKEYFDIEDYSIEETGSSLGEAFFKQMLIALLLAFLLMGLVVFIAFRNPIPSLAVILSAASDMIVTLAILSLLNVKLSLAGIAAFLMLIGYSVDTDILLTTRVLKRKRGTVMERVLSALETGFTMNLTTLAAVSAGLLLSQSSVLKQIMLILFIGLVIDMINTWIQNVGILRLYLEKKPEDNDK